MLSGKEIKLSSPEVKGGTCWTSSRKADVVLALLKRKGCIGNIGERDISQSQAYVWRDSLL